MDLFRVALGEGRILAEKFPMDRGYFTGQREGEPDGLYSAREYVQQKMRPEKGRAKRLERSRQLNPNGFFEMEWSVRGISYSIARADILKSCKTAPVPVAKVVSQGLANTDPQYITKIVYLIRNPRSVAKSQENLRGKFPTGAEPERNGQRVKENSVNMFCNVNYSAAQWFIANPHAPHMVIEYDELIQNPNGVCADVGRFIGEGDWQTAAGRVDPKLKRSEPKANPEIDYTLADKIYSFVRAGNWPAVADAFEADRDKPIDPAQATIVCTRLGRKVVPNECSMCKGHKQTTANYIQAAAKSGIDWAAEPCIRDVATGAATIKGSIEENHWLRVIQ
jgi:hypothetical protein